MTRRLNWALAALLGFAAVLSLSGCIGSATGRISGTVSLGRGGPGAAGVTITAGSAVTTTDSSGSFLLKVPAGTMDVVATRPGSGSQAGLAASRLQGVSVSRGRTTKVEMVVQPQQIPGSAVAPPTVGTSLIPGRRYSGAGFYTVYFQSALPAYRLDIRYGHRDLLPDYSYSYASPETSPIIIDWDTTQVFRDSVLDDGRLSDETYILVTLYDVNYNSTELVVPILLGNTSSMPLTKAVEDLTVEATTAGQNPMLMNASPLGAGSDSMLFTQLDWTETSEWRDIQNYRVYRSFVSANGPWDRVAEVPANASYGRHSYWDSSSLLAPGRTVWYYVTPHNAIGEGPPSRTVMTKPLPRFSVELVSPSDGQFGVDTQSFSFSWRVPPEYGPGGANADAVFSYRLAVSGWNDSANTWVWPGSAPLDTWEWPAGTTSVAYSGSQLQSAKQYQWDIKEAFAKKVYQLDGSGQEIATAVAYSGWPSSGFSDGSLNGPFTFTTQL